MNTATKVIMRDVRCHFPHVFEPYSFKGEEGRYSIRLLIPKDNVNQIRAIENSTLAAAVTKFPTLVKNGRIPNNIHVPLRDGDEKADDYPEYKNCYFIDASSKSKPSVFSRRNTPITADDMPTIYAGCRVNVSIAAGGYDWAGNKGVKFYLNGVQFYSDDEPLSYAGSSANDFKDEGADETDAPFDKGASDDDGIL